jgi:hypothetical protein
MGNTAATSGIAEIIDRNDHHSGTDAEIIAAASGIAVLGLR